MSSTAFDLRSAPLDRGTVLLEASAGTGKTYNLVGILLRLLLEKQVERLDQVLVVTFTIAATDELKNRLRRALVRGAAACEGRVTDDEFHSGLARHGAAGAAILRNALDSFDEVAISTIHGFCKRLLDDSAFESREPFELDFAVDEVPLWQRAAEDALRAIRSHDGAILGTLLCAAELTPKALVQRFRMWQRHPDVHVEPAEPRVAERIEGLRIAAVTAATQFDTTVRERLLSFRWNKGGNPFEPEPERALYRLQATLRTAPADATGLLHQLSRTSLTDRVNKTTKPRFDHPFFVACDGVTTAWDSATSHLRSELLRTMRNRLQRNKAVDRVLSFPDLLERTHAAVHDPRRAELLLPALRERFRVALIDEFQDTDSLQYGIFATCFANRPLFLVGDPKQSIYSFRGADLRTYAAARDDAIDRPTLDVNFRSSDALVRAVTHLFGGRDSFVDPELQLSAVRASAPPKALGIGGDPGPALRWHFVPPNTDEASGLWPPDTAEPRIVADVTAEIARLLTGGFTLDGRALRPRDIAVLTRTNRQATLVQDRLRDAGIVSAIGKAGDVFETDELGEVERVLLAVLQPNDLQRARSAMATRLWGVDAERLLQLEADDAAFDAELLNLERWRHTWFRRGFVVMKEQLLAEADVEARFLATSGGERRLTNFQQIFEMLHEAEHEHHLAPDALLQWLRHEKRHKDEIDYQRRELRLESDEDAVQILTVHGSKGLQYEIVFCPFAWGARAQPKAPAVVSREDGGRELTFDAKSSDAAMRAVDAERLAEDVRLCYVALTRAKRRCYLHWGAIGTKYSGCWRSALGWLLHGKGIERKPGWEAAWATACRENLPSFGDRLQRLVAASGGTMSYDEVPLQPVAAPVPSLPLSALRSPRRAARKPVPLALHSFTSIVANATASEPAPEVRDPATPAPTAAAAHGIFAFQRGAVAGQCLHAILEHADLDALDADATAELVAGTLQQFGLFDAGVHDGPLDPVADVLGNLRALARARVDADGPTIAELCRTRRIAEWPFTMPLPDADTAALAALFRDHGSDATRAYAPRIERLPHRTLHGFLGGFADLVAEHGGRHWIVDWKSNHLGDAAGDYGPAALQAAMFEHDYVLQYHLYLVALHRHLAQRLRDYSPERHLGGACYPFLRGATADSTNGIWCDRPPVALILAMDRWAAGGERGRRT